MACSGRFFKRRFPVGDAARFIIIYPRAIGPCPTREENHMAVRHVEQIARLKIVRRGEAIADRGQLRRVVDRGQFQATGDEPGTVEARRRSAYGLVIGPAFGRAGNIARRMSHRDRLVEGHRIVEPAPFIGNAFVHLAAESTSRRDRRPAGNSHPACRPRRPLHRVHAKYCAQTAARNDAHTLPPSRAPRSASPATGRRGSPGIRFGVGETDSRGAAQPVKSRSRSETNSPGNESGCSRRLEFAALRFHSHNFTFGGKQESLCLSHPMPLNHSRNRFSRAVFCHCLGLLLALTIAQPSGAAAETRLRTALVIGNARYETAVGKLRNTDNDAKAVAATLRSLGFAVIEKHNVTPRSASAFAR